MQTLQIDKNLPKCAGIWGLCFLLYLLCGVIVNIQMSAVFPLQNIGTARF
jgi:hypothetical protein